MLASRVTIIRVRRATRGRPDIGAGPARATRGCLGTTRGGTTKTWPIENEITSPAFVRSVKPWTWVRPEESIVSTMPSTGLAGVADADADVTGDDAGEVGLPDDAAPAHPASRTAAASGPTTHRPTRDLREPGTGPGLLIDRRPPCSCPCCPARGAVRRRRSTGTSRGLDPTSADRATRARAAGRHVRLPAM